MLARSSHRYESYRARGARGRRLRRLVGFVIALFLLYMLITTVFLKSVLQDSVAMEPTLSRGDRLFLAPLVYGPRIEAFGWQLPGIRAPRRGDLVLVRPAYLAATGGIARVANPVVRFVTFERVRTDDGSQWRSPNQIKRIVGVPGDTVRMERFVAYVRPAGEGRFVAEFELAPGGYETATGPLPEGWAGDDPFGGAMQEITLGEDEYFVLGDNRPGSVDSRHWGVVSANDLHGAILFRYWPLRSVGGV